MKFGAQTADPHFDFTTISRQNALQTNGKRGFKSRRTYIAYSKISKLWATSVRSMHG